MFIQFPKKTLFSKLISGIIAVSFIITSVPVRSYANSDKLRRSAATDGKRDDSVKKISAELENASEVEVLGELVNFSKRAGFDLQINQKTGKLTFPSGFKSEGKWTKVYNEKNIAISFVPENSINTLSDPQKQYFGFRDVFNKADEAKINELGLRYDITVLPPGKSFGKQLNATQGHEHPVSTQGDTYPEIYEVMYGEALYVQQSINKNEEGKLEVIATFAKAGDKVVLLPGYSHRTVNVGNTYLVMANWISNDVGGKNSIPGSAKVKPIFAKIEEKHGYAYLIEEENGKIIFRPNPSYAGTSAVLKLNTPIESISEIGLDNKVPMYGLIRDAVKAKTLSSFLKLTQGKGFGPVFASAFKELAPVEVQARNVLVLNDAVAAAPVSAPVKPAPATIPARIIPAAVSLVPQILVLDNEVTLFNGANTGAHNIGHAMLNKADGALYNHSEPRARLELSMSNLLKSILRDSGIVYLTKKEEEAKAIKDKIQNNFISSLKVAANLDVLKLPENEKNKVLSYLEKIYSIVNEIDDYQDKEIELLARSLVNKIVNVQLKDLIARSKAKGYPIKQTVLCVGETKAQYLLDRTFKGEKGKEVYDKYLSENTKKILAEDLTQILDGITKEDADLIGLRIAYEPRWAINTGLTPSAQENKDVKKFIKDTSSGIFQNNLVLDLDYGGSLNAKNAEEMLAIFDGGLIGGAAKDPEVIGKVIKEAIKQGQKRGKVLTIGMNWKAEDQETGLKPLAEFEKIFKSTDLSKVRIVISTPQVPVVKSRMAQLTQSGASSTFSPDSLGTTVAKAAEEVGSGYTKDILVSNNKLEEFFKEKTKEGDTYLFLKKGDRIFALAKENANDQTLITIPSAELKDNSLMQDEYYANLLEYTSILTTKTGKGLELITVAGEELKLKSFLSRKGPTAKTGPNSPNVVEENFVLGNLIGIKRWMGTGLLKDEFFQFEFKSGLAQKGARPTLLTFKKSKNKSARGWSAIVQPKYTHLIFGFGTIGSDVAKKSRELGFNVVTVNRSANEKAGYAQSLGIPLYLLSPDDKKAFDKAKVGTEGILEDLLKSGEVDLITDATDGETEDPQTKEEITVAAYNTKYIYSKYPNIKIMYEGAEDPKIANKFFDSGTLNVLKVPYSKIMGGVNSLFFPSCNTTGQGFILDRVTANSKDLVVRVTTGRRANDPGQKGKLSPDGTAVETGYHHAEDYLEGREAYSEIINAFRKGAKNKPSLTTDASNTHLTKFHITEMWISGFDKKTDKRLTAETVKKFLSEESRIALVDFKKDKFDATLLLDILFNKLSVIHPFTPIVQVLDLPSGDVKITMAVPQESIVIPNNMNGIHALTGLYEREASTRLVNDVMQLAEISQAIESTLPLKSARVKAKESKEAEVPAIAGVITYTNKGLEDFKSPDGKPVYATLNTDVGDIEGEKVSDKQDKKLIEGYDNLERLSKNNALYILGHNGRPAGKYVEKLGLFGIAKWYAFQRAQVYGQGIEEYIGQKDANGRFIEASYWIIKNYRGKGDVKVWFLPDTDEASIIRDAQIIKDLKPGDWAIAENRRMDIREQAGDPAGENPTADPVLREAAIKDMLYRGGQELLVGPTGFNFGTADVHRFDARITAAGKYILLATGPNVAEFVGRVNKVRALIEEAHKKGAAAFVVSGLKKDKIELLLNAINNVLLKGDKVIVAGAINAYPLAAEGKTTGKMEIKKDALEMWKEVVQAAKAKGIEIYYPKALKVVKDLKTAKKEDILTIQDGNIPEGYVIGDLDGQALTEIFNILGDGSVKLVLQSGPVGPFDLNDLLAEGSNEFQQRLAKLAAEKVSVGSDSQKANKKAGVEGKFTQYTDGGSFLDALTCPIGEDCPAIAALKESARVHSKLSNTAVGKKEALSIAKIIPSQTTALGSPTVRLDVELTGGAKGHFVVPAGTSTGEDEAKTVGVEKALENLVKIQNEVTKKGLRADQLVEIGQLMLSMGKDQLGAEATLSFQMAAAWAAASQKGLQPYEFIRELAPDLASKGVPVTKIQYNITNGGAHADNSLDMQEFMIVARGKTTAESNKMCDEIDRQLGLIYQALGLKADPDDKGVGSLRGKEGGYKIEDLTLEKLVDIYAHADSYKIENLDISALKEQNVGVHEFVLNCLLAAIQNAGYEPSTSGEAGTAALALDAASTSMLVEGNNNLYNFEGRQITSEELVKIYGDWVKKYPIDSIEDGLGENDWEGWMNLIGAIGDDTLLIGDDLLVTQGGRLQKFIQLLKDRGFIDETGKVTKNLAILIKLNQNGFLTTGIDDPEKGYLGTLEVIRMAKKHGIDWVVSHRSKEAGPEENEVSIAELAAGTNAYALKSGDHVQAVRAVKEDRLAAIDVFERTKAIEKEAGALKTDKTQFETQD